VPEVQTGHLMSMLANWPLKIGELALRAEIKGVKGRSWSYMYRAWSTFWASKVT
jgi:hypothetical protein